MKRGGISVISHKYAKANNEYLPDYNPNVDKSYLIQLDCNNLYGWAMNQKLPTGNFQWVEPLSEDFIKSYDFSLVNYINFHSQPLKYAFPHLFLPNFPIPFINITSIYILISKS